MSLKFDSILTDVNNLVTGGVSILEGLGVITGNDDLAKKMETAIVEKVIENKTGILNVVDDIAVAANDQATALFKKKWLPMLIPAVLGIAVISILAFKVKV